MAEHRYKSGQTVRLAPHARYPDLQRSDLLEVVRPTHSECTERRYRAKDLRTGTQRVVEEHDLEAVMWAETPRAARR